MILKIISVCFLLVGIAISQDKEKGFYSNDFEWNFENSPENKTYIDLAIAAVSLMNESERQFNILKTDSLLEDAKKILIKIVSERKHFYKAHISLATVYIWQRKYGKARLTLDSLNAIIEYPSSTFYLGILSEKENEIEEATQYYERALLLYDEYSKTYLGLPTQEKEYLLLLLHGKEKSIKRVQNQIENDPNNQPFLNEEFIVDFDRKKFIEDF